MSSLLKEIDDFTNYCKDFYNNKNGVYKIATEKEIEIAVDTYLFKRWTLGKFDKVEFDSVDRERVRIRIQHLKK